MDNGFFFLVLIEGLKNIKRRGWVIRDVPNPESVSDHMYRMAIMCLMAPELNESMRTKALKMALVHDMGEAIIGDIAPSDGISREQKHAREEMALKFLKCTLDKSHPILAESLLDLWEEYEANESPVAKFVHEIDKLECIIQAVIYQERNGTLVDDFMNLQENVTNPGLQPLLQHCLQTHNDIKTRHGKGLVVIFVSGGPGVGKGTQCARLAAEFDFCHISVGDLLREEAERPGSPYHEFIPESIKKSILIPPQLTTLLLKQKMDKAESEGKRKFLLDGFPRNVSQALDFTSKICKNNATLSFACSEADLEQRLQRRSAESGRIDDNTESILKRLQTFHENNAEVIEHLQNTGLLYHIDGSGSIDDVYAIARESMKTILQNLK